MLEIPESSKSKTVSALNSSIDKTSVSCKFIINIKDEKENLKEFSEKSRRLIVIQDYENKEDTKQKQSIAISHSIRMNEHPDLCDRDSSHPPSTIISSHSSTSSKVSIRASFLEKTGNLEAYQNSTREIMEIHKRRSNINIKGMVDLETKNEEQFKSSKDMDDLFQIPKFYKRKSFRRKRDSKINPKIKGIKSSYRELFRSKYFKNKQCKDASKRKAKDKQSNMNVNDISRRKTIM